MTTPRIMIVTGEASGDLHGARLVEALQRLRPGISVCGMGGPELERAGVEILFDAAKLAVVGILEVASHLADIRRAMRVLEDRLRRDPPELLILVDLPDFNFILGSKARKQGIPILYYISPQIWAWRTGRVRKIRRFVDRMAVILPFEQDFYARHGVKVDFVGHPLLDSVRTTDSRENFLARHGIDPDKTVVGILPGSREKEIKAMLPVFLAAARQLAAAHPGLVFLVPQAPTLERELFARHGLAETRLDVRLIPEERYQLMASCQAAMAASGTVTLELAILKVPMLVSYKVSPLTYLLGRRLIKVEHAALVNLVAGQRLVPELLQHEATPEAIARQTASLLFDSQRRQTILDGLAKVRKALGGPGASERTARIALEMIGSEGKSGPVSGAAGNQGRGSPFETTHLRIDKPGHIL